MYCHIVSISLKEYEFEPIRHKNTQRIDMRSFHPENINTYGSTKLELNKFK